MATVPRMDRPRWDPEKERINQAKHGISFRQAREVLLHGLTRRWPDIEHADDGERTISIGITSLGEVLLVVTALGHDGRMRIISARRATKRERHAYEER